MVCLSCSLYWLGDAVAAIAADNVVGRPSDTVAKLYWVFWVFERVPLVTL